MNNSAKIACCNICLLSEAMKACQTCPLNPANLKLTAVELAKVEKIELLRKDQTK